jgi:putative spermidine/putrescine transport system permease protein
MSVPNKQPFDAGRAAYLALNFALLFFLLAPIAIVLIFALNPTPYISFPPVGVSLRWFDKFFTAFFMSPLMLPAILTGLALFQSYLLIGIGRPVWGLILAHTLVAVPYVIRTTLAVLHNFDRRIEEAAAVLGASPVRVFFEVTLPLIRPGVFAGGVFAFIVSFDQFPVSLFLVVPKGETLPVVLFNYMRFDLDGAIAAASMVSILLALSVVLVLERLIGLKAYVKL